MEEIYELPQGKIIIGFSNRELSIGLLVLNSGQSLPKHNRPVNEELLQIKGKCMMKVFSEDSSHEIELNENSSLKIPANTFHIHSNPFNQESITLWKFQGDITSIIDKIRSDFTRI